MNVHGMQETLGPNGFYEKRGETGILLIHGLTGTPAEMRHFGRQLARKGLTVACPQLAGHCDSVQALKASTWEDWYASVDQAFEALAKECRQVYVAGLSMGALLGLLLAVHKKERLAGVTLLSPTFFYDGWNMPKWRQRLLLPLIIYSPLRHFISWEEPPPYGIKDERVRRPTLVVHSVEDDMASIKNAHFVAKRIASDRVETYFVDDCYHVLTLDKRKDDIANRVASFCAPTTA